MVGTSDANGPVVAAGATPAPSTTRERERQQVFEFTRRKRWADILMSEAPESILLILNPHRTVLYCGPAVVDLLGWQPENIVDFDLLKFMNDDDSQTFANNFNESLTSAQNLVSYVRLKCKSDHKDSSRTTKDSLSRELLFEITGKPLQEPEEFGCRLYFAVAKPYPSRNTAIMNTFLELKIENERLTQDLKERRLRLAQATSNTNPNTLSIPSAQMYGGYSSSSINLGSYGVPGGMPENGPSGYTPGMNSTFVQSTYGQTFDDIHDDGSKKKLKKGTGSDPQYVCVTCGRTSSPEWRKGPMGPKTLCNACGLRWAKRSKKTDDTPTSASNHSPPTPKIPQSNADPQAPSSSMSSNGLPSSHMVPPHENSSHSLLPSSPLSMPGYQHMHMGMGQPLSISTTYPNMSSMTSMHSPTAMTPTHYSHHQHQQLQTQSYAPPPFPPSHQMDTQMWAPQARGHHQSHGRYPGY